MHAQWAQFEEDVDDVVPLAIRALHASPDLADSWCNQHSLMELSKEQEADADIHPVIQWLKTDAPSEAELALASPVSKALWRNRSLLSLKQGVLYYRWYSSVDVLTGVGHLCYVVPRSLVKEVFHLCHNVPLAGHFGQSITLEKLRSLFYWPGMTQDCSLLIAACPECSRNKKARVKPRAPLGTYHAGTVMERVHMDILGPLPRSRQGNVYVLVVVDQFTKWTECFALPDQTAERVATVLVNEFICRLGCPSQIHTDRGTNFESGLFRQLCELLHISKTRTTPYRPRSNGQVERLNRTILQMIRCFLKNSQLEWDLFLPQLAGAIRGSVNRNTGFTPNLMMLGREVSLPRSLVERPLDLETPITIPGYVIQLQEVQRQVHQAARQNLQGAQRYQKSQYDSKQSVTHYGVGDLVYLSQEHTKPGLSKKLSCVRTGPFLIIKILSPYVFQIRGPKRVLSVHHDRLRPYKEEAIPMWVRRARHQLQPGEPPASAGDLSGTEPPATAGETPATAPPAQAGDNNDPLSDIRFLFSRSERRQVDVPKRVLTRAGRATKRPVHLQDYSQ